MKDKRKKKQKLLKIPLGSWAKKQKMSEAEHKERRKATFTKFFENHPDYNKAQYQKHREKILVKNKTRSPARRKEDARKNREWFRRTKEERYKVHDKWVKNNRDKWLASSKRWRQKLRAEMIEAYGGKCKCCEEMYPEFLSIDHIDGKGAAHRRKLFKGKLPGGNLLPLWLRKRGWPTKNFRLLCMNCNWALGKYGYCPHNKRKV